MTDEKRDKDIFLKQGALFVIEVLTEYVVLPLLALLIVVMICVGGDEPEHTEKL